MEVAADVQAAAEDGAVVVVLEECFLQRDGLPVLGYFLAQLEADGRARENEGRNARRGDPEFEEQWDLDVVRVKLPSIGFGARNRHADTLHRVQTFELEGEDIPDGEVQEDA